MAYLLLLLAARVVAQEEDALLQSKRIGQDFEEVEVSDATGNFTVEESGIISAGEDLDGATNNSAPYVCVEKRSLARTRAARMFAIGIKVVVGVLVGCMKTCGRCQHQKKKDEYVHAGNGYCRDRHGRNTAKVLKSLRATFSKCKEECNKDSRCTGIDTTNTWRGGHCILHKPAGRAGKCTPPLLTIQMRRRNKGL